MPIGASTFALPAKGAGGFAGVLLFLVAVLLALVWAGALVALAERPLGSSAERRGVVGPYCRPSSCGSGGCR
ncbi:MAG: hypothetical protein M5U28_07675 [Sandaracinaceae bacterium]|nr:hypothetical protein [Sandaracinaceae bacterium]